MQHHGNWVMPSDFTYSLVILRLVLWGHFLIRFAHVPTASTTVVTYYVYCLSRTIHGACLWELGHFHLHFSHLTKNLPWHTEVMQKSLGGDSVQFSCSVVLLFATPWTAACQAFLAITNSRSPPKPMSIESVMPSNHLILCHPLLLLPSIFPSIRVFSNKSAFRIRWPNIGVSASKSVPPMNTQDWSPLEWTGWSPCSPRDSQESSPTPQFKSINSALSFLYSPTLTSIHDHWKSHSLD